MSNPSWRRSRRVPGAPRPRHVLIVLALCALAGSLVGGNARPASAAGTSPHFVRTCAAVPKGEMRCFALRRTTGVVAHVASGVTRPSRSAATGRPTSTARTTCPTTLGRGKTVAIVDAYDDPNAASDLSTYRSNFGLPACTTANGCFKKVNQNGATSPLPAANTGWAGGDHARPRDGLGDLPELSHPARRGEQPDDREPRHGRQHGRRAGRGRRLEQLRRLGVLERDELRQLVLQAPRRGDRRLVRRQRLRRRVSGRVAVRDCRRRDEP